MGASEFRLRSYLGFLNPDDSDQKLKPSNRFFRNFGICPHCEKKGGPFMVDRLNDEGPMISRSDGESFHLVLGDRPISFPAEKSSGRTGMMTAGFWYVKERNKESEELTANTETVVVILRKPPAAGAPLMKHLEKLADQLAEELVKPEELATLYEFEGNRLQRVS